MCPAFFIALLCTQSLDDPSVGLWLTDIDHLKKMEKKNVIEFPRRDGFMITGVFPASPAAEARLNPFDIVVSVNQKPIKSKAAFIDQVTKAPIGTKFRLEVLQMVEVRGKTVWGKQRTAVVTRHTLKLALFAWNYRAE